MQEVMFLLLLRKSVDHLVKKYVLALTVYSIVLRLRMSDFKDSLPQLLKVFLEDNFELLSLSEGFIGRRNLPYPKSHLFTQTD